jgi:hypothetical protein
MIQWNVQIMSLIQYEQTSLMGHCIVIRFVSEMTLTNLRCVLAHVPSSAHVSRIAIKAMASDNVVVISLPLVPESTVLSSNSTDGDDGGRLSALLLFDGLKLFL